jgi:uncharacterized membrane protein
MDKQEQIREAKREYMRNYMRRYRQENKEKIKEHTDRYWYRRAALEVRSVEAFEAELEQLKHRV